MGSSVGSSADMGTLHCSLKNVSRSCLNPDGSPHVRIAPHQTGILGPRAASPGGAAASKCASQPTPRRLMPVPDRIRPFRDRLCVVLNRRRFRGKRRCQGYQGYRNSRQLGAIYRASSLTLSASPHCPAAASPAAFARDVDEVVLERRGRGPEVFHP